MVIVAHIFGGDEGVNHVGRNIVVGHADTILVAVVSSQQLQVGGNDFCGELVFWILQFVQRR